MHFPVITGHKALDALFPLDQYRKRGSLYPADRGLVETAFLGIERCHGARAVDPDQPVRFRTADCGIGERSHFRIAAKLREAVTDGRLRHGLQPQPFD